MKKCRERRGRILRSGNQHRAASAWALPLALAVEKVAHAADLINEQRKNVGVRVGAIYLGVGTMQAARKLSVRVKCFSTKGLGLQCNTGLWCCLREPMADLSVTY